MTLSLRRFHFPAMIRTDPRGTKCLFIFLGSFERVTFQLQKFKTYCRPNLLMFTGKNAFLLGQSERQPWYDMRAFSGTRALTRKAIASFEHQAHIP